MQSRSHRFRCEVNLKANPRTLRWIPETNFSSASSPWIGDQRPLLQTLPEGMTINGFAIIVHVRWSQSRISQSDLRRIVRSAEKGALPNCHLRSSAWPYTAPHSLSIALSQLSGEGCITRAYRNSLPLVPVSHPGSTPWKMQIEFQDERQVPGPSVADVISGFDCFPA